MKTAINAKLAAVLVVALGFLGVPSKALAQDSVEASAGADLVSNYVWRGQLLGGFSVQPSIGLAYKGFSLGAWGSVGIDQFDTKEFDLTVGYSTGAFSASITDYWFDTAKYFTYGAHSTAHVYEAQIGYDFGKVALNWYTNFAGADGVKENGKRAYSSYFLVTAPFALGGVDFTADLGIVPWETNFYNGYTSGFAVTEISLTAAKELKVADFTIPAFAKVSVNPRIEGALLSFGVSF